MEQNIIEKYEKDLEQLIAKKDILINLISQENRSKLIREYQSWYTEACEVVEQLIPKRISEFKELYQKKEKTGTIKGILENPNSFSKEKFRGISIDRSTNLENYFDQQFGILESAKRKLKSSLMNIKTLTQAELFDSELEVAGELKKNGFLRPAGTVAGVVLESHLKIILSNHNIDLPKKKSLSKYNDQLKNDKVIDVRIWRNIQWLTDVRNLCCHSRDEEPTKQNVSDLIDGVNKIIKTVS